jgi:hypothetical protein
MATVSLVQRIPLAWAEHDRAREDGWRAYVEQTPCLRKSIEVTPLDFVLVRLHVQHRQALTERLYRVKGDKRSVYLWVLARFLNAPRLLYEGVDNWLAAEKEVLG